MTTPLLLLHGALGSRTQFEPLLPLLQEHYPLYTLDFEGHGASPLPERPFRIEHFAENVLAWLDEHQLTQVDIFGYSMGGYVALYLATLEPARLGKILTLATKFNWTPDSAAQEVKFLDPAKIEEKVPRYAEALQTMHGSKWREVVHKTKEMMLALGQNPPVTVETLAQITLPVRVSVGDRDTMVSFEETRQMYAALPQAEFQVLPGTPHPIDRIAPEVITQAICAWF